MINLTCKQRLTRVRNEVVFVVLSMFAHWQAAFSPNLVARYDALAVYVPMFSLVSHCTNVTANTKIVIEPWHLQKTYFGFFH